MELDRVTIGRVSQFSNEKGVGKIVTPDNIFMFTIDDLTDDSINNGDLVKFRAEKIHDEYKAFFVSKCDMEEYINKEANKNKVYKNEYNS